MSNFSRYNMCDFSRHKIEDERMDKTEFFVEANSNEISNLYYKYALKTGIRFDGDDDPNVQKKIPWEQDNSGFSFRVGYIKEDGDMGVSVSFTFVKINYVTVCFYEATSRYVDHTMVEEYLKEHFPIKYDNNSRNAMCDASNFASCLHYCIKKGEKYRKAAERKNKIASILNN